MPTVNTQYVTYVRGKRRRHAANVFDIISGPFPSTVSNGGQYGAFAASHITMPDGTDRWFKFWSVTGALDGDSVSTNPQLQINVGNSDVSATAWYIPGNGTGEPGVVIDAFDINLGNFVDDDFVDVTTDASLTPAANDDGWVPTEKSGQNIRSYQSIHGTQFQEWMVVYKTGTVTVTNRDLNASRGSYAIAFAFFKATGIPHIGLRKPNVRYIPGEDSIGIQLMKWLATARIPDVIEELRLKPMSVEDRMIYSTQTPTQFRCAISAPHLHYRGKTYLLTPKQWKTFATKVQKELGKKLTHAKSVKFDKLAETAKALS